MSKFKSVYEGVWYYKLLPAGQTSHTTHHHNNTTLSFHYCSPAQDYSNIGFPLYVCVYASILVETDLQ